MLFHPLTSFLERHERLLWWMHSGYALLLGVFVMWLGSRKFVYLRVIVFYIAFIWVSSLFLPALGRSTRITEKWRARIRLVVNYFNKNFYQQLLFFVLPLYYSSATSGSRNMLFVGLVAVSAVLSTMDIVYDRYVSARWPLTALFFAFNLFACINVMLPVLWSVSNYWALWISGVLALAGFGSILYRWSGWPRLTLKLTLAGSAVVLGVLIFYFGPLIPPAPLRLTSAEFGRSIKGLVIVQPLEPLPSGPGKVLALTAIRAPLGLHEQIRHCWYLDGKLLFASAYHTVTGGREEGYRFWTQITWKDAFKGKELLVDVETRGGQLIGRTRLPR